MEQAIALAQLASDDEERWSGRAALAFAASGQLPRATAQLKEAREAATGPTPFLDLIEAAIAEDPHRIVEAAQRQEPTDPIVDLMHMQGEKHFYERRPQRDHIHMACLRCGKITEFESDLFDRLKVQIQRDCHFHIVVTRLECGGYCSDCRTQNAHADAR